MKSINLTGRVTSLATLTRMLGWRCVIRLARKRKRSPLAMRVYGAAVNECDSSADSARLNRRVGRCSGR
eukprot:3554442-Pleurochrysis_carterae.AAC.2